MTQQLIKDMMDNIVHIGNKSSFWDPKMREFIFGTSNSVHILDLNKTAKKLDELKTELSNLSKDGKSILFVSTKIQSRETIRKVAQDTGNPYVSEKWVPGLLTNFRTIKRRISTYLKLLKDNKDGSLDTLTKKEKSARLLELEKLDKAYAGLKDMKKLPDAIFVADGAYESQAVVEAKKLNIPVYALLNTNGDIDVVENFAPINTNSFKSIKFCVNYIKEGLVVRANRSAGNTTNKMTQRTDKKIEK